MDQEKGIIIKHGKVTKVKGPITIEDAPNTPEPNPFTLKLMPWEKWWQESTDLDFMRDDPEEANHPIRIRMGREASRVGGKVLDVGCGTAIDYPRIRDLGLEYWAVEPIPKFIDRARELHPEVKILQARAWDIPFKDNEFDVVWCKGVVQHLPTGTYPEALDEMWRVCKTLLMVSTNRVFWAGDTPGITQRLKHGPYNNHYNFKDFNYHVRRLSNSVSRYIKGFIKGDEDEAVRKGLVHTLFLVYNKDYWDEHHLDYVRDLNEAE